LAGSRSPLDTFIAAIRPQATNAHQVANSVILLQSQIMVGFTALLDRITRATPGTPATYFLAQNHNFDLGSGQSSGWIVEMWLSYWL